MNAFKYVLFITLFSASVFAQENPVEARISGQLSQIIQQRPSLASAFSQFIHYLSTLVSGQKIKDRIKVIEQFLMSIVQTTSQAIQLSSSNSVYRNNNYHQEELLIREAILSAYKELQNSTITRKPVSPRYRPTAVDDDAREILDNCSHITNYFFNILKEPENEENVTENLVRILVKVIDTGKVIAKKNVSINPQTPQEETQLSIALLDPELKEHLSQLFEVTCP